LLGRTHSFEEVVESEEQVPICVIIVKFRTTNVQMVYYLLVTQFTRSTVLAKLIILIAAIVCCDI